MNETNLQLLANTNKVESIITSREEVYGRVFHPIHLDQRLLVPEPFDRHVNQESPVYKSGYTFKGIPFDIEFKACLANLFYFEFPFGPLDGFHYIQNPQVPLIMDGVFYMDNIESFDVLSEWMLKVMLNNRIYRLVLFKNDIEREDVEHDIGMVGRSTYSTSRMTRDKISCFPALPMNTGKLSHGIEMQFIPRFQLVA